MLGDSRATPATIAAALEMLKRAKAVSACAARIDKTLRRASPSEKYAWHDGA